MEEEGQQDHQAEHRQPRRVRLRGARRDRAGHDPQPAARGRLYRQQGPVRAAQGGHALHPGEGHRRRDDRRHLPRQRRLRADRDGHERAAQRRRRGADPGARLSAVDRRRQPVGRHAGALPLRRSSPAGCPTSTTSAPRSRRAPRAIVVINPNNPTGALYPDERAARDRRDRAPARADHLRRRDLRQDAVRRRHAHRIASLADDVLFAHLQRLSKNYRSCGYRAGWMVVSGDKTPRRATTSRA